MGKKKGSSFITGPPFEVLLVLVFTFLVLGFVIVQSGGIQAILEMICEKVPALCLDGYSTKEYETSKQSTSTVFCGLNVVGTGEEIDCGDVRTIYTSEGNVIGGSITGAATAMSEGFETIEYETEARITGPTTEEMIEKCEEECNKRSVPCDCISCTSKEIPSKGIGGYSGLTENKYKVTCNVVSQTDEASLYCNFKGGYPELEYDEGCGALNPFCDHENVWYFFDSGDWKWKCIHCGASYHEYKPIEEMNSILAKVDDVHKEIKTNLLKIDSMLDDKQKFEMGVEVLKEAVEDKDDKYGQDDSIIVHHKSGNSERIKRGEIGELDDIEVEKHADCFIKNFYLPQKIEGERWWNKWIAGLGDPNFLVYWQKFPEGEDSGWSKLSTWTSNIFTIVLYAAPISELFGTAKRFFVGKIKDIPAKSKGFFSKLLGKIFKTQEKITQAEANTIVIAYGKGIAEGMGVVGRKDISKGIASYHILDELKDKPVAKDFVLDALKTGNENELVRLTTLVEESFEKLDDVAKAGVMNKYMGSEAIKLSWEDYRKVMKAAGVATGVSLLGWYIDSLNDKFFERPNSIMLQTRSFAKNDIEEFKLLGSGIPILLDKDYNFIQKTISTDNVPFYLVSPCRADLNIFRNEKPVPCGNYKKDIDSETTVCIPRDDKSWSDKMLEGNFEKCDSLPKDNYMTKEFLEAETDLINDIVEGKEIKIFEKDVSFPGNITMVKYHLIKEPITGVDFYFNHRTNYIDFVQGENNKDPFDVVHDLEMLPGSVECSQPTSLSPSMTEENLLRCTLMFMKNLEPAKSLGLDENIIKNGMMVIIYMDKTTKNLLYIEIWPGGPSKIHIDMVNDENGNLAVIEHYLEESLGPELALIQEPEKVEKRTFSEGVKSGTNCLIDDAIIVSPEQSPYSDEKHNYCYTKPSKTAEIIFGATILLDIAASAYFKNPKAKLVSRVIIGFFGGTAEVISKLQEKWPG